MVTRGQKPVMNDAPLRQIKVYRHLERLNCGYKELTRESQDVRKLGAN